MTGHDEECSADTDDLDAFVVESDANAEAMGTAQETLRSTRGYLSGLPLPFFVDETEIDPYGDLAAFMGENGTFVRDISSALKLSGTRVPGTSVYKAPAWLIDAELDKSDAERLDEFEAGLVAQGVTPDEAAAIRSEVEDQLDKNPELSFYDAVLAGTAAYQGITVEELEQRIRAFSLYPAEVGAVIDDNFDVIAGQTGDSGKITIDDLLLAVEDESLPQDVRDAAYRLAADGVLFTNMDVANQTDFSDEPLANGFNWSKADGEISKDDTGQFNDKNHQAQILLAWHPLIDTANQDYDLTRADSHVSEDDVVTFVNDPDIPLHVRLAVAQAYADKYPLLLTYRVELEEELAFKQGQFVIGGTQVLEATGTSQGRTGPPLLPRPVTTGPGARPAGGGGAGGGAGAVVVAVVIAVATKVLPAAWNHGRRQRIERDGEPAFVHTHPVTGVETVIDPAQLEGLSPEETKAYIAYFATYGGPPPEPIDTIEPFPYLDATGQWRMSDTGEPVHSIPPPEQWPEGQYYDERGILRFIEWPHDPVNPKDEPEPEPAADGAGARDGNGDDGDDDPVDPTEPRQRTTPQNKNRVTPPSWVATEGFVAVMGDANPTAAAERIMNQRYGRGNYPRGPNTEYSRIHKWLERYFIWS